MGILYNAPGALLTSFPDDADKYDGAPAAVQIFGRRFDEEKLLSIAQLVVDAMHQHAEENALDTV